ncbi:MAG: thiamine-phosphate kinase, partial [Deltaproteobacteria bacterium]|nr:thiamine-phosphate kinase [Deltaproteobacteria bacterium]
AAAPLPTWVEAGIGDDCAVLQPGAGQRLLVTTDMLVEGVHFRGDLASAWQIGYKAMAVNLGDVAAMGGEPLAAWLAIGLRPELGASWVEELSAGLLGCAGEHGVQLLGGDTVASPAAIVLCLTLLGQASPRGAVLRSGARPGDRVLLGGMVGDSAAGLHLLRRGPAVVEAAGLSLAEEEQLRRSHLLPAPQVGLGRWLAGRGLARAMIDVSDGVLQDLGHICTQSGGVGAEVDADALPLSAAACRLAAAAGLDARDWALSGGEDYVLLFCVRPGEVAELLAGCRAELGLAPTVVGTITAAPGLRVRRDGVWQEACAQGFDHFKGPEGGKATRRSGSPGSPRPP